MEGRFEADFDVSGEDGDDGGNSPIGEYSRVLFNSGMRDCRSSNERSEQKGECACDRFKMCNKCKIVQQGRFSRARLGVTKVAMGIWEGTKSSLTLNTYYYDELMNGQTDKAG